ncbi:MAG TPA: Flp family type IVb pilin [Pseudolabrys sp.]|jgi:pilus assembly protein Flp/PilA
MRHLIAQAERFVSAQEGATAIEYAIIASGIAGAIIVGVGTLGGKVVGLWTAVAGMF